MKRNHKRPKYTHVSWTSWTVHRLSSDDATTCGIKVPDPLKVGGVGYYINYQEESHPRSFCANCRRKQK